MQEQTNSEHTAPINTESLALLNKLLNSAQSSDAQQHDISADTQNTDTGNSGASPTNSATAAKSTQTSSGGTLNTPSADLLSSLLSNPELISKLPQMISLLKPLMSTFAQGTQTQSADGASGADSTTASAQALASDNRKANVPDNRAALLHAMKPYLSRERREAIDYIVKLERLGEILKSL